MLNFQLTTASDPMGCRLNPASTTFVRFYANDPDKPFTVWTEYMIKAARLARDSAKAQYDRHPRRTYAVGASNGGYQVRRAIEEAPDLFDGGVDWEGTHAGPNVFVDLPLMLRRLEPTGKIKRPLVTVAGTMDALLPAERHARAYADKVGASRQGSDDRRHAQYRLWEIQNGNHIDSLKVFFPQLQRIMPHTQHAFDLLVEHVETRAVLPPSQCVPTAGAISATPAQPGLCPQLLVP